MHKHGGDIYENQNMADFSANINYLGMPASVRKAAMEAVDASVHYPDVNCTALKKAIAERDGVPVETLFCGNGAADVIFALIHALCPKKAILPAPSFYEYQQALESVGCAICHWFLKEEEGFRVTEAFLDALTPDIDILFLCNPNNPTGELVEPSLLRRILARCKACGIFLVMDECFNDFLDDPKENSLEDCLNTSENLLILRAFTKIYAMAGLRLGYGITVNRELVERMEQVTQPWRVSVPAQAAGVAAVSETEFVKRTRTILQADRAYAIAGLEKLGLTTYGSRANYIFFRGPEDLAAEMKKRRFLIRDCENYPGLCAGFYRIAVRGKTETDALLAALIDCLS